MKMITAIIRPEKVDEVLNALEQNSIPGVTITDVLGRGEQGGVCLQVQGRQNAGEDPPEDQTRDRRPGQRCGGVDKDHP